MDPSQKNGPNEVPPGIVTQAQQQEPPITGAAVLTVTWEEINRYPDNLGRDKLDALYDPGTGTLHHLSQPSPAGSVWYEQWQGGTKLVAYEVPLRAGDRSNGPSMAVFGTGVYLLVMTHNSALPYTTCVRARVADWVGGGGTPGPGGGITRAEVAQMISDALANFHPQGGGPVSPQDISAIAEAVLGKLNTAFTTPGSPIQRSVLQADRAAIENEMPDWTRSQQAMLTLLENGLYQWSKDRGYESDMAALAAYFGHPAGFTTASAPTGETNTNADEAAGQ